MSPQNDIPNPTLSPDKIREAFNIVGEILASTIEKKPEEEQAANIIKVKEAAQLLNISIPQVYVLYHSGRIKGKKIGVKGIRIFRNSLDLPHGSRSS